MRDPDSSRKRAKRMEKHHAFVKRFAKRLARQGTICHIFFDGDNPDDASDWRAWLEHGRWHWSGVTTACHHGCMRERARYRSTGDNRLIALCEAEVIEAEDGDPDCRHLLAKAHQRWQRYYNRNHQSRRSSAKHRHQH